MNKPGMGGLAFAEQQSIWKLIVTLWSLMAGCAMAGEYSALLQEQSNFLTMVISGIGTMVLIVGVESYLEMFQANNLERYQTYDQYLSRERRRSIDRTRQMFVLNGVHDALAQSLAEDATIGRAVELEANRRVKVLHGTFGSGKSLSVERTIQAVKAKGKPPRLIPVKFGPGGVTGALNDCLPTPARQLGRRKSRALLIAIEDLHGYADAAAVEILDGARRLAEEGAFVIITTRHPPRQATEEEKVQVADLTEDEAQALIARIQGERPTFQAWHGLSDALRNSLTSPFMAIAFASCTLGHTGDFPQTRAQLTASLLTLLETRVAGQTNAGEILGALRRIAVESTDDGGRPILPPADVSATAIELASRAGLLTREGSRVNISLPIIREWLAAEALVRQEVPWDATVLSLARAISWRGAVEAAIARGTANQVARLLGPLARQWIGIAAEVIHRMTSGWGPIAVADQPTTQEAAERLLEAMQALVDGLGPSSAFLAPTRDGRLLTLSIAAYGGSISYRWLTPADRPWELLERRDLMRPNQRVWRGTTYMRNLQDSAAWAWVSALKTIEDEMERFLNQVVPILENCPAFASEFTWRNVRAATGVFRRINWDPIPLDRAEAAILELDPAVQHIPPIVTTRASVNLMLNELQRLRNTGSGAIEDPHPYPRTQRQGGWIWSAYTYDEFVARSDSILRAAIPIYQALVDQFFPSLRNQLRTSWTLPASVRVWVMPGSLDGSDPQLWPHAEWVMTRREGPTTFAIERAPNHQRNSWDAVNAAYARHVQINPVAGTWFGAHSDSSGPYDFLCEMPATTTAIGWLKKDLENAGFGISTLGRWRYGGST